jgi:hypothetical protein
MYLGRSSYRQRVHSRLRLGTIEKGRDGIFVVEDLSGEGFIDNSNVPRLGSIFLGDQASLDDVVAEGIKKT